MSSESIHPEGDVKQPLEDGTLHDIGQLESSGGGVVAETARVLDHAAERALCRKFDFRLLPVLAVMCKIAFCGVLG